MNRRPALLLGVLLAAAQARASDGTGSEIQLAQDGADIVRMDSEFTPVDDGEPDDADHPAVHADLAAGLVERAARLVDRTNLGGFGEHALRTGSNEVARFMSLRYGLLLSGQISERITTATELLVSWGGTPLKQAGWWRGGEVRLGMSVVDILLWRGWSLRAGVLLVPVGTVNRRHDGPSQELVDLPLAYTSIVPTVWSDVGVGLVGAVFLPHANALHAELYVVNGLDARIGDGPGFANARASLFEDNNRDKALTGRLAWTARGGGELGLSGYFGAYDPQGRRVSMVNLDAAWRHGPVELQGEVVWAHLDPGYVQGFAPNSPANTGTALPGDMLGFYGQVLYRFGVPYAEHWLANDLQDTLLTAVLRYEGQDTDLHNASAVGDRRRLTLGLNARPAVSYVVKAALALDTAGMDGVRAANEVWTAGFWQHNAVHFAASVAYMF